MSEDDTSVLSGYSIGTSATRADVLKKIGQVGYVKKKGKSYSITDLGINLVEIFPVDDLFDVDFTGKLEKSLFDIQKGNFSRKDYLNMICKFVYDNVNKKAEAQYSYDLFHSNSDTLTDYDIFMEWYNEVKKEIEGNHDI